MQKLDTLFNTIDDLYFDNSPAHWLRALLVLALVLGLSMLGRRLIRRHYARMAETERVEVMEVPLHIASRTATTFLVLLGLFAAMLTLKVPEQVRHVADKLLLIAVCWQVGVWVTTGAVAWLENKRRATAQHDRAAAGSLGVVGLIVRMVIWSVVLLLTLDNLGVNITTLVAGFGIGGIAVALAVQNVLGDLLASLSITLDKPFVEGDLLVVDQFQGHVEQIGLKSTRLRSVTGEQIVMTNADLLKSRLRNFGRMSERRMTLSFGVMYETASQRLELIPALVKTIVQAQTGTRFDRCHLVRLGAAAIEFEATYFVRSAAVADSLDVQHAVSMELIRVFQREGIAFAYPTQRLLLEQRQAAGASA